MAFLSIRKEMLLPYNNATEKRFLPNLKEPLWHFSQSGKKCFCLITIFRGVTRMSWIYFVLFGCLFEAVFICFEYTKKPVPAVILKGAGVASVCIVGHKPSPRLPEMPVLAESSWRDSFSAHLAMWRLICASLRGGAGQKVFVAGIAAFLTGHLLYIAALTSRGANAFFVAVPFCALLSAAVLPWMLKRIEVKGKLRVFGIVYVALVFLMAGCAAGLLILKPYSPGYLMFAIGAALFAFSDVILIFHLFGKKKHKTFRALNLSAYYIGQLLIALSIMLI